MLYDIKNKTLIPKKKLEFLTRNQWAALPHTDDDFVTVLLPRGQAFKLTNKNGAELTQFRINRKFTKPLILFFQYLKAANWNKDFSIDIFKLTFPLYGIGITILDGSRFPTKGFYDLALLADALVFRDGQNMVITLLNDYNINKLKR